LCDATDESINDRSRSPSISKNNRVENKLLGTPFNGEIKVKRKLIYLLFEFILKILINDYFIIE
jgi:hypothetical protein